LIENILINHIDLKNTTKELYKVIGFSTLNLIKFIISNNICIILAVIKHYSSFFIFPMN